MTDPPYGVEYDPKWRLEAGVNKAHRWQAFTGLQATLDGRTFDQVKGDRA